MEEQVFHNESNIYTWKKAFRREGTAKAVTILFVDELVREGGGGQWLCC
jgi:hypothetical protein